MGGVKQMQCVIFFVSFVTILYFFSFLNEHKVKIHVTGLDVQTPQEILDTQTTDEMHTTPLPQKWVSVSLVGRLGNQLFLAASSYGIAKARDSRWCISNLRGSILEAAVAFNVIPEECPSDVEFEEEGEGSEFSKFHSRILTNSKHNIHVGEYLQSHKYFIRSGLPFRLNDIEWAQKWVRERGIKVGIHVRRGDYAAKDLIGNVPTASFYENALAVVPGMMASEVVVCTDDPVWVESQPVFRGMTVSKSLSPHQDMSILAACPVVIVSIGTFGWWGAYLSQFIHSNGTVIFNNMPYKEGRVEGYTESDAFPESWIGVSPIVSIELIKPEAKWIFDDITCKQFPWAYTCAADSVHIWSDLPLKIGTACSVFHKLNIRTITFCGDSYIRHVYQAMLLVLTEDYETGSMKDGFRSQCSGDAQFEEKYCRHGVPHVVEKLCGGTITLRLDYGAWCIPKISDLQMSDLFIWGGGSHPVNGDYQSLLGVNDAAVVRDTILKPHCPAILPYADKIAFMLPHYRTTPTNSHESALQIEQYVEQMPSILLEECNISRVIDTHLFTQQLVNTVPAAVVQNMTWDGAHWSRSINVVKAWFILRDLLPTPKSKESCTTMNYPMSGEWINKTSPSETAPPCCSWDNGELLLNSPEYCSSSDGPSELYRGAKGSLAATGGHGCACVAHDDSLEWSPSTCVLDEWDATTFCNSLGERTVLLIGDSTMGQAATSLMNAIGFNFWNSHVDGCQDQIIFALADTLVKKDFGVLNRGKHWLEHVREQRPDMVIISGGPHFVALEDFQAMIDEVTSDHQLYFPQLPLVWKSQFPGGCGSQMLQSLPGPAYWEEYSYHHATHNYGLFDQFDAIAAKAFKNGHFLDVGALKFRPELHIGSQEGSKYPDDCLHMCMSHSQMYFFPRLVQMLIPSIPRRSRPMLLIGVFITDTTPISVRDAFRNSTVSMLADIKLVFFVGREGDFKNEQTIHGDIVQGNFAENMNEGKTYEWMLWASTQDADYVIKMDTDVSVVWHPFLEWIQTMKASTYFGRINNSNICGGDCPPAHCVDFSGDCWIYMSGGMYGFSMDVVKSIVRCEFAKEHPSGTYEDTQSAHWVKNCVPDLLNVHHMDNGLLWCHQTNLDMLHISLGVIPSGCGSK